MTRYNSLSETSVIIPMVVLTFFLEHILFSVFFQEVQIVILYSASN